MYTFNRLKNTTKLSQQEYRILKHLINGLGNKEIAEEMKITIHTVKVHISSIIKKFQAKNRTHAACLAIKKGLTDNDIV